MYSKGTLARAMRLWAVTAAAFAASAGAQAAVTIHRSFRSRDVGLGGGASVSVPVDSRIANALDSRDADKDGLVIIGKVTRVMDGDTLWVTPTRGFRTKVRICGIDAPESGQPFFNDSKKALSSEVFGKTVKVEIVSRATGGDVVGKVFLEDRDIGSEMVRGGFAWSDSSSGKLGKADYSKEQAYARQERLGLWKQTYPVNPRNWRNGERAPILRSNTADASKFPSLR